jgi:UDP-N-acetylmuramoyl-tripeptide--D-alanyl-D-alanine ligase
MWAVTILRKILYRLARLTIWRYRPGVIGVTGSAGKTSTKLAIKAVLERDRRVRISSGNLNNSLGLPLTILGDWTNEELAGHAPGDREITENKILDKSYRHFRVADRVFIGK